MNRIGKTVLLAMVLLSACRAPGAGVAACKDSNPDVSIGACTALLQSGGLSDTARANALQNRGIAYRVKGDYDRAIADHDQAITLRPGFAAAFNSRGFAYQLKGDFERAIADYNAATNLKPDLAAALKNRGRTEFYLGRFADAATDLRAGLRFDSSNAYNVIWLYLATMRLGSADAQDFAAQLVRTDSVRWPAPVARFYLGRLTAEQLMAAASKIDARIRTDQRCSAAFYIGESELWLHRFAEAAQHFREAVATCSRDFSEYQGAAAELGRSGATAH
jgi:lipoprotein NlpI